MSPRWPHGDPVAVARAVLADPRYAQAAPQSAARPWWDILLDPLRALWHAVTAPLRHLLHDDRLTSLIGVLFLIAVLVALLVAIVRLLPREFRARPAARPRPAAEALAVEQSAATLRARARAAAAAGRFHEAAALLWLSALHALDESGRVGYDAARTPREWRRAVGAAPFDRFARDAVVALFGERDPDAALVARLDASYDAAVVAV